MAIVALCFSCSNTQYKEYNFQIENHASFESIISSFNNNLEEDLFPYKERSGEIETAILFDVRRDYSNGDVYYYTFDEILKEMRDNNCRSADLKELMFFYKKYSQRDITLFIFGDRTKRVSEPSFGFPVAEFKDNKLTMYHGYDCYECDCKFLGIKE